MLVSKYRPISTLPTYLELEDLLTEPLTWHLKHHMSADHHCFLSTCTKLVSFADELTLSFDSGSPVDVVYTEFDKVFNVVSHQILFKNSYGFWQQHS